MRDKFKFSDIIPSLCGELASLESIGEDLELLVSDCRTGPRTMNYRWDYRRTITSSNNKRLNSHY